MQKFIKKMPKLLKYQKLKDKNVEVYDIFFDEGKPILPVLINSLI